MEFTIIENGEEGALQWYREHYENKGYIKKGNYYETSSHRPYKVFHSKQEAINEIVQRKYESLLRCCYENQLDINSSKLYDAILVFPSGHLVSVPRCKLLKQSKCPSGYYWVKTSGKNAEQSHRVIAKCFIPNPNSYPIINHIDGNKTNNNIRNLEWCTRSYNVKHAYANGLEKRLSGELHHEHKLSLNDVIYIRSHYKYRDKEYGATALGRRFNVDRTTIADVANYKSWRNLNND